MVLHADTCAPERGTIGHVDWNLIIIVLMGALGLVAVGFFVDREAYKRCRSILDTPPERPVLDAVDTPSPTYIDAATVVPAKAQTLSEAEREQITSFIKSAQCVNAGYASPDFVTDSVSGWAVIKNPRVLVVDEVSDPRELYSVLAASQREHHGFVVVSPVLSESVSTWLLINATSGIARCLGVRVSDMDVAHTAAAQTNGQVVTWVDLKSGYLPEGSIGQCAVWVSGPQASWAIHHRLDNPDEATKAD